MSPTNNPISLDAPLVRCDRGHQWHANPPEILGFRAGDPCPHVVVIGQRVCGQILRSGD